MTCLINVDSHQKKQRFIVTISMVRMQSLFTSNSWVYCTTCYHKCNRIGTKWLFFLFVFFFTFIEECCVVIEKNIDKKLANRISDQI